MVMFWEVKYGVRVIYMFEFSIRDCTPSRQHAQVVNVKANATPGAEMKSILHMVLELKHIIHIYTCSTIRDKKELHKALE